MDFRQLCTATLASLVMLLAGCGGGTSSSNTPTVTVEAFTGPGSKWDVDLRSDGEFTFTRRANLDAAVDLTVNGTYQRLASGFLALTVTSATGDDAPEAGDTAWGLEVPGFALFLKPDESGDGRFIAMVTEGTCPTADLDANWVMVKKSESVDATGTNRDFFGSFSYDAATDTAVLPGRYALADGFPDSGGQDLGGGTCDAGIMRVADGVMYLTDNGGALVHTNVGDDAESNIIFAMAQSAVTSVDSLDGTFSGLVFDSGADGIDADAVMPITMSCTAGLCGGELLTDVVSGGSAQASFNLNLTGTLDQPATGLITGSLESDGNAGNVACMANSGVVPGSDLLVSCVGQAPGDNRDMFNAIFVRI